MLEKQLSDIENDEDEEDSLVELELLLELLREAELSDSELEEQLEDPKLKLLLLLEELEL